MKVLIVEDNRILSDNIKSYLDFSEIESKQIFSWWEVVFELASNNYDVIILDIWLPDIIWLEVCKRVREKWLNIPILMLTARSTVQDKVSWLNVWADDYLTKPFDYEELLARLNSLVRRHLSVKSEKICLWDGIEINVSTKEVFYKWELVELSKLEFKLLTYLAKNKWNTITKEELLEKVWWEFDSFSNSRNVDVYVWYLRKKLWKDVVKTKRGVWYIIT